jgi:CxxC motif-containing protein
MAAETTKLICITCPVGCELTVTHEGREVLEVEGNQCKLGIEYAEQEISDPRRMIITTVRVKGGFHPLVPVRSAKSVPKEKIFPILKELRKVELEAPVEIHQVVLENALDTGVDVVTSRSLPHL